MKLPSIIVENKDKIIGSFVAGLFTVIGSLLTFLIYNYTSSLSTQASVDRKIRNVESKIVEVKNTRKSEYLAFSNKLKRLEQALCIIEQKTCELFKE